MARIEWNQKEIEKKSRAERTKLERQGAKLIADDAKRNHTFKNVSGDLEVSIHHRKSRFKDGGYIAIADDWKAHFIELGRHGVPAQPFMRQAKERNARTIIQSFKDGLTK